MVNLLLALALLVGAADDVPADGAASGELARQVARLIDQLSATTQIQRDAAEQELIDIGPKLLTLLPTIDDDTPAEVAVRLVRVQQQLFERQAKAAAQPSLVTLSGKDLPLADVLAAIAEQTGNTIVDYRPQFGEEIKPQTVSVDFDKTTFWQAMDDVLDQAGLTLYGYAGERGAYLVSGSSGQPRKESGVYAGLFRLQPVRFEAMRDLRNPAVASLRFYFEATWEPRLQPFAILQPLADVSAVGDNGQPIALAAQPSEPEATIRAGMAAVELDLPLELPPRSVTKIDRLKGKLRALVPGALEEFRFAKLVPAARNAPFRRLEQRKAGATVTIEQLRKNNDAWSLGLKVKFADPSIGLETHRSWILDNEAYFQNAAGEQFTPGGFEQTLQSKDEMGVTYFFVLDDDPQKLEFVYRTPITVLDIPLEYEFRDLPLP